MDMIDDDFKQKVSDELFNMSYDISVMRKALLSISEDIQLNMSYCDVLAIVMEENDIIDRTDIDTMVLDLNRKRNKRAKEVMSKVSKQLKAKADEHKSLMDILDNAPFKGEA